VRELSEAQKCEKDTICGYSFVKKRLVDLTKMSQVISPDAALKDQSKENVKFSFSKKVDPTPIKVGVD